MTEEPPPPAEPIPAFRPPTWGRVLGLLVILLMALSIGFSIWVMFTYWDRISV